MLGLLITPAAKVAALTPMGGLNYSFAEMVSYAVGPFAIDLPTALACLYVLAFAGCIPHAVRAFRSHQVA